MAANNEPWFEELNPDQQRVVRQVFNQFGPQLGQALALILGAAGTGKSTLLRSFTRYASENGMEPILLPPSGVAANHIQGQTIHGFFGISRTEASHELPSMDPVQLALRLQEIQLNRGRRPMIMVDECSMVSSYILEVMSQGLRQALGFDMPFRGCPILFFGDFAQLGPVVRQGPIPYIWTTLTNDYLALRNAERIQDAWLWLQQNNPLYDGIQPIERNLIHGILYSTTRITSTTPLEKPSL